MDTSQQIRVFATCTADIINPFSKEIEVEITEIEIVGKKKKTVKTKIKTKESFAKKGDTLQVISNNYPSESLDFSWRKVVICKNKQGILLHVLVNDLKNFKHERN